MKEFPFKKPNTKYYLGLDLGIASLGWAVFAKEELEEKKYLHDFGVRIWKQPIDRNKKHLSVIRRGQRSQRRLIRRRQHRKIRLLNFLISIKFLEKKSNFYEWVVFKTEKEKLEKNPEELKLKGLKEKLEKMEFVFCLINYSKRRGYNELFQSFEEIEQNKKDLKGFDQEKIKETIAKNQEKIDNPKTSVQSKKKAEDTNKYLKNTLLGMSCKNNDEYPSETIKKQILNKNKEKWFYRSDWERETKKLLETQSKFYEKELNEESKEKILDIIFRQRYSENGPGNNSPYLKKLFHQKLAISPFSNEKKKTTEYYTVWVVYKFIKEISFYLFKQLELNNQKIDEYQIIEKNKENWKSFAKELTREFLNLKESIWTKKSIKILSDVFQKYLNNIVEKENLTKILEKLSEGFKERKRNLEQFNFFYGSRAWVFDEKRIDLQDCLKENNLMNLLANKIWKNFTMIKRQEELKEKTFFKNLTNNQQKDINDKSSMIYKKWQIPNGPFKEHMHKIRDNF